MAEKASSSEKSKPPKNFLRQFRDKDSREFKQISASQFMDVWNHYDADGRIFFSISYLTMDQWSISLKLPTNGHYLQNKI